MGNATCSNASCGTNEVPTHKCDDCGESSCWRCYRVECLAECNGHHCNACIESHMCKHPDHIWIFACPRLKSYKCSLCETTMLACCVKKCFQCSNIICDKHDIGIYQDHYLCYECQTQCYECDTFVPFTMIYDNHEYCEACGLPKLLGDLTCNDVAGIIMDYIY